ncbi:MAG: Gfo/Idh/MocA family oxidoreductase, partial [Actinomycetes bacterium]
MQALDHVDIVGITDLDVDRAAKRAAEYGIRSYPNLDDLVAAGADTIHVLTPPAAHHDVAVR